MPLGRLDILRLTIKRLTTKLDLEDGAPAVSASLRCRTVEIARGIRYQAAHGKLSVGICSIGSGAESVQSGQRTSGELKHSALPAAATLRGCAEEIPSGVHQQMRIGIGAIGTASEAVQNTLVTGGVDPIQDSEVGSAGRCGSV